MSGTRATRKNDIMFKNCSECGLQIFDSPKSIERHMRRHPQVEKMLRLELIAAKLIEFDFGNEITDEEPDDIMCAACKEGDCNLCDGGICECPCAIDLDVKVRVRYA